jgi:tRNA nucleotidyltransferase (CCA-adding enzyme)
MTNYQELITDQLLELHEEFAKIGKEFRFVGGVVRDMVMGLTPSDIDLVTDATENEQIQIFNKLNIKIWKQSQKHLTSSFTINDLKYEITPLKTPDTLITDPWHADLSVRDFTINAINMKIDGNLFDPYNGIADIKNGKLRFVGSARERIDEDPIRIFRWFRFLYSFNLSYDIYDMSDIRYRLDSIKTVAVERVWSELKKILVSPHAYESAELMSKMNVLYSSFGLLFSGSMLSADDIKTVFNRTDDPVTRCIALYGTNPTVDALRLFKASKDDINKAIWIGRNFSSTTSPFRFFAEYEICRDWTMQLAALKPWKFDEFDMALLESWDPPAFPLTGDDLIGLGYHPSKEIGQLLSVARHWWADCEYLPTKQEIIDKLPELIEHNIM